MQFKWWHLFVLALGVRLLYCAVAPPPAGTISGDAAEFHSYAISILDKGIYEDFHGFRAHRMPGFPAFLAIVYSAFGRSILAVQIAQSVLGAFTAVLIGLAAVRLVGKDYGLLCGAAAALYYGLFATPASVLSECLAQFFLGSRSVGLLHSKV